MPFHRRRQRWGVLCCHRRAGKTVAAINDLIRSALVIERPNPRVAYLAPYRVQARSVAWDFLLHFTACIPGRIANISDLTVILPGDRKITLYGADNFEGRRGLYLDGVVLDEAADVDPRVWSSVLLPMLSDREGWCVWMGTLKRKDAFSEKLNEARDNPEKFFHLRLRASESGILAQAELAEMRSAMDEGTYAREMECDLSHGSAQSIYGVELSRLEQAERIRDFEFDRSAPLLTFWDIGVSDFTAVWLVQMTGPDISVLNYRCWNGQTPAYAADRMREWEQAYGRPIRRHYLPHDANSRGVGGQSYVSYLSGCGISNVTVVPRTPDVWLGIQHLRTLLPRCYIHRGNCDRAWKMGEIVMPSGLGCLEGYHKSDIAEGLSVSEAPVHDFFSHGADAMRTFAEAHLRGMIGNDPVMSRSGKGDVSALTDGLSGVRRPGVILAGGR